MKTTGLNYSSSVWSSAAPTLMIYDVLYHYYPDWNCVPIHPFRNFYNQGFVHMLCRIHVTFIEPLYLSAAQGNLAVTTIMVDLKLALCFKQNESFHRQTELVCFLTHIAKCWNCISWASWFSCIRSSRSIQLDWHHMTFLTFPRRWPLRNVQ